MSDEKIMELAQIIKDRDGVGLVDAMIAAEAQLRPKEELQDTFEVTLKLKPRVARWVLSVFTPTSDYTREQRMAAYLEGHLNRARATAIRAAEEAPDIVKGEAVTMTRDKFMEKAGT